jgi:hypothetical protein
MFKGHRFLGSYKRKDYGFDAADIYTRSGAVAIPDKCLNLHLHVVMK